MSANNRLIIYKENLIWKIKNIDVDGAGGYLVMDEYQSLEDAIRAADEYMVDEEVEYGYRIILPK